MFFSQNKDRVRNKYLGVFFLFLVEHGYMINEVFPLLIKNVLAQINLANHLGIWQYWETEKGAYNCRGEKTKVSDKFCRLYCLSSICHDHNLGHHGDGNVESKEYPEYETRQIKTMPHTQVPKPFCSIQPRKASLTLIFYTAFLHSMR